jgi:putative peptidoglycan lipid II flippase
VSESLAARGPSSTDGDAERRRITGRASIVAAGTLASRLLGLVRDQVIAAVFSRAATDVFFVALLIPNVLRQLLAEGAVQNAVLPVLAATREKEGEQAAKRYFRAVRGLSLIVLCGVSVAGVLAAPWLVELFASGFREHPGQFERTVTLTRWVFPYILLIGTAALGVAALNTYARFTVAAFAPGLLNVAFIACALALPGWLRTIGWDVVLSLAIGTLLGGVLQAVAQWPSLRAIGYLDPPSFELGHPGVRETLRRMGPVLFGIGIYFIDVVLARRFLSELDVGSQSYFAWALRLCDFPQGIFVMALQSATLPSLALIVARGEREELSKTFAFGLRLALFVGIAATALVVALAEPLVVMIFQRGEFDAVASRETARALVAQGLGIWTVAAVRQLVAVYYAVGDTRSPVVVAATDLGVFIAVALLLRGPLGHVGISIAVSAASTAQMILLFVGLRRHLVSLRLAELTRSFLKTAVAAAVAGLAGVAALYPLGPALQGGAIARLAPGLVGTAVFTVVFLISARMLKSEELETLLDVVRRRRARKRAA